jgi:hypothetical protein
MLLELEESLGPLSKTSTFPRHIDSLRVIEAASDIDPYFVIAVIFSDIRISSGV